MPIQTDQERQEMQECAVTFKENANAYREAAKETNNKDIKARMESIAVSFTVNAKILEAFAGSKEPDKDKYQELFPGLQKS